MVWAVDKNPSAVYLPSVRLEHEYDQSDEAMAEVPALSPLTTLPPESALSAMPAVVTPPETDSHQ